MIKSKAARVGGLAARNKILNLKEYGDLHAGYNTSVLQMTFCIHSESFDKQFDNSLGLY